MSNDPNDRQIFINGSPVAVDDTRKKARPVFGDGSMMNPQAHGDKSAVAFKKRTSKYAMPTKEQILWIILDIGNADVKAMIQGHWGEEIYFPHAVRLMQGSDYADLAQRYKYRPAQFDGSAIFEYMDSGYVVGFQAEQSGYGGNIRGSQKYTREHFGALFVATMLQLYPMGHENVKVVVLHPADATSKHVESMIGALKGRHEAHLPNGNKVTYKVTGAIPLEEVVSGFQCHLYNTDGQIYAEMANRFRPGSRVLVLDLGGGKTSFLPVIVTPSGKLEVNLSATEGIDIGILDVLKTLDNELRHELDELKDLDAVPDHMLLEAASTGKITLKGGEPKDVSKSLQKAMKPLETRIRDMYKNAYGNGFGFAAIIISGGGGGIAFEYLKNVLQHNFIYKAESVEGKMRFANIRGAGKGLVLFLAAKG